MNPWKDEDVYIDGKMEPAPSKGKTRMEKTTPSTFQEIPNSSEKPNLQEKESSPFVSKQNSNAFRRSKKRSGERFVRKVNELKFPMLYFFLAMLFIALILKLFEKSKT